MGMRGPGPPPEARALAFVYEHTSIPVPKIRRYVRKPSMIVMDRIPGTSLYEAWPLLSPFQRILVAWTLRGYIEQLRHASAAYSRRHVPGPMYGSPLGCDSPSVMLFDSQSHSLPTSGALIEYFNTLCRVPLDAPPGCRFIDDAPLVFTHNDLCPRNIILGEDGRLWMIDFGESGFYPPWFEYLSMIGVAENRFQPAEMSWWDSIALIAGYPSKEVGLIGLDASRSVFAMRRKCYIACLEKDRENLAAGLRDQVSGNRVPEEGEDHTRFHILDFASSVHAGADAERPQT
ncbi:hypothetical protein H0H81_007381 [Sphagnurus paluster]|uniref:Aminoglycoside phosphotransferase domain-containing protein n=1 Tax=Sphagnurus paluster TaxID=117069 RepID=A0A9P7KKJ7_9AGAR|nr:hypothetical protein H0H81_007381 [Sphagnurus paluster]